MVPWMSAMAMQQGHRFAPQFPFHSGPQAPQTQRGAARNEAASLETIPAPGNGKTGLLIFLHGLGMSGIEFGEELEKKIAPRFSNLQLHYPNAPFRPVTYLGGERLRAWFDLDEYPVIMGHHYPGLPEATAQVHALIRQAEANGIPANRIVLAGFSQGGALALSAGLTYEHQVAGIGAFSAWVPGNLQMVAKHKSTPIFFGHGDQDAAVPFSVGVNSCKVLRDCGFTQTHFAKYSLKHVFAPEEFDELAKFVTKALSNKAQARGSVSTKPIKHMRYPSPSTLSTDEGETSEDNPTTDDEQQPARLRHFPSHIGNAALRSVTPQATTATLSRQGKRDLASRSSFHDDMSLMKNANNAAPGAPSAAPNAFYRANSFLAASALPKATSFQEATNLQKVASFQEASKRQQAFQMATSFQVPASLPQGGACQSPNRLQSPNLHNVAQKFARSPSVHPMSARTSAAAHNSRAASRLQRGSARSMMSIKPPSGIMTSGPCPMTFCRGC